MNTKEGSLELMGFDEEVVAFDDLADNDENFDWENISGGTTEPDAKAHSALLRRYKRSCQSKNIYLVTRIFSSIFDQEKYLPPTPNYMFHSNKISRHSLSCRNMLGQMTIRTR